MVIVTSRSVPGATIDRIGVRWTAFAVVAAVLVVARFVTVGADTFWAVALGRTIAATRSIPDGVPFAAAPSAGWPNVPVLAELLMAALGNPVALAVLQTTAVAVALVLVAVGARRQGAGDAGTAVALALVVLGALPALGSVKLQVLSLALVPLLLLLLRADHAAPSARIWLLVPLVALWGNLHGAVLVGVALAGVYLALSRLRRRPLETVAVSAATVLALAANPALLQTGRYYVGVLTNEAARRGTELWARPDPRTLFGALLVASAVALVALALAQRPPLWEVVALLGLAAATVVSARHGVWLLMMAAAPAAQRLSGVPRSAGRRSAGDRPDAPDPSHGRRAMTAAALVAVLASAALVTARQDELNPSGSPALAAAVGQAAAGGVVLADSPAAESLAAAGIRVWVTNPLDAFDRMDQAAYLDFLSGASGNSNRALDASEVVVTRAGAPADRLVAADPRFTLVGAQAGWSIRARVR